VERGKDAFAAAIDAWSKVEIYHFGPVMEQHLFDRLFYWPDSKSLGLKQVQDALARKDETVATPGTLAARRRKGRQPHDVALLSHGRPMVIADGGIRTHPDSEGQLNLPDMQPSLVYVDTETGDLLEEHRLAPALHQLSIRYLAIGAGDAVAFGCQYRGPEE